jgi:hypothetical protein
MLDRVSTPADELLGRINAAVAVANDAERRATTAREEHVARSKTVGLLLLEAKKMHPAVEDFDAFLKRVDGLHLSRAYDCMRIAGGRITDEEIRQATRDRVKKHRAKKKPKPEPKAEPKADSVTGADVTESSQQPVSDKAILLGALETSWHFVREAAATGRKAELRTALKRHKFQINLALASEVLKKTPRVKTPEPSDLEIPECLRRGVSP